MFIVTVIVMALIDATNIMNVLSSPEFLPPASRPGKFALELDRKAAPIATSGDNTYIAWWTNKTGNDEVQFRVQLMAAQHLQTELIS